MCGRYSLARAEAREIQERFGVEDFSEIRLVPRFNIAPTQDVATVISANLELHLATCRWGLIPSWVQDLGTLKPMINARAETLIEKPFFKKSLARKRCLILADGFFEWRKTSPKGKEPFWIHLKDQNLFAFAGLWDEWKSPSGELIRSCTIVTTQANTIMTAVHDRMPVILRPEQERLWSDETMTDPFQAWSLLQQYPDELMTMHVVSNLVNKVANDTPDVLVEEPAKLSSEPPRQLQLFNFDK